MFQKTFSTLLVAALFLGAFPPLPAAAQEDPSVLTQTFETPIDAISFRLSGGAQSIDMQYRKDGTWSDWNAVEIDADVDPVETQMFMLPVGVTAVRTRGNTDYLSHPIRVSSDPVTHNVASTLMAQATKKILSRADWGADPSLLYEGTKSGSSSSQGEVSADQAKGDNSATTAREKECVAAQRDYPEQFKTSSTVTKDSNGTYRWPLQYGKEVHLFVVHHTALLVNGDTRPAVERMRALYQYHANSRGWGDIGYNFIIDEKGQIYEGRNGGLYTVAGHAYCNNVGTIGISLMGNFELEQPSQEQVKSLQWLLKDLSQTYKVDLNAPVEHHGKRFLSPVVGHRDVVPTTCPGYYMNGVMGQVVANVRSGNVSNSVVFTGLKTPPATISQPATIVPTTPGAPAMNNGLSTQGRTTIATNPGGQQRIMLTYTAGIAGGRAGTKLADVRKSAAGVKIWQIDGDGKLDVSGALFLQYDVPGGETQDISLLVQMPVSEGTQWIDIGSTRFTFQIAGRRVRTGTYVNPFSGNPAMIVAPPAKPRPVLRATNKLRSNPLAASSSPTAYQPSTTPSTVTSVSAPVYPSDPNALRVRLSVDAATPTVTFTSRGSVGGTQVSTGQQVSLFKSGTQCIASFGDQRISGDAVTLRSDTSGYLSVDTVKTKRRGYRGALECRIVDGQLALINELSIDDYMNGLSEEPDTEPYQKQRAFAIAARTYAAYYMADANRKFPGKPYDGSDDPAIFQSYTGVTFEEANPRWLDAVTSTAGQVLMFNGQLIKPPYFSSDDGRTRTPKEAGWNTFPFIDIFTSKDDPWCKGMTLRGHGVGMSGCGAKGQANEGRSAEQILQYYYPGTRIGQFGS